MKDVHSQVQSLHIAMLRFTELLDLFLKHGENATRRIANLEPASKWVLKDILFCALLAFAKISWKLENVQVG